MTDKKMSLEEVQKLAEQHKKELTQKTLEATKTLADYVGNTPGELSIPLANGNAHFLVSKVAQLLEDEGVYVWLWAICNQDNRDLLKWGKAEISESLWEFRSSINMNDLEEYEEAILTSMGLESQKVVKDEVGKAGNVQTQE